MRISLRPNETQQDTPNRERENTMSNTETIHETTPNTREIKSEYRKLEGYGNNPGRVILRYDDRCGNGHNTFSITMESKRERNGYYGCMHDTIRKAFPEYAHLTRWHLVSTDAPMHYIANTLYHAKDNRIEAAAKLDEAVTALADYQDANEHKPCAGGFAEEYVKTLGKLRAWISINRDRLDRAEGPNLEFARSSACAPNATLEQLQDKAWLEARLAGVLGEFKAAMDKVFG
jgi:hypothetical protein